MNGETASPMPAKSCESSSSIPRVPGVDSHLEAPSVTTDSEWASHAVLHAGRSDEAYTQVVLVEFARPTETCA